MNIIDIIIIISFAICILLGFKDGVIRQLGSLAGIIIAIFLAKRFGAAASELLGIGGDYAQIWGYVIVFIIILLAASLTTKLLSKLISFVGLGALDRLAGALLAAIKCALILSIICTIFGIINNSFDLVERRVVDESKLFAPVASTSKYIMPAVDWITDQLPTTEE